MDPFEITAQAIGILAMAFNILSFQQKTYKKAVFFQFFGASLFAVNFFMLGAIVGGIMNVIAVFRAFVYMNKKKFHTDHIAWLLSFILFYITSYILTFTVFGKDFTLFNAVIELLPVVGMTATNIGLRLENARAIRRFGLISSPSWLAYNIANFAVGAIICEVLSLISIFIGIIRFDIKKEK